MAKRKRKLSHTEARALFDRVYENAERRQQAAIEAFLRTPEGDAARKRRNAERLKKNPAKKRKSKRVRQTVAMISGTHKGKRVYYRLTGAYPYKDAVTDDKARGFIFVERKNALSTLRKLRAKFKASGITDAKVIEG